MTTLTNQYVRFEKRPTGKPDDTIFSIDSERVPALSDGEFLFKNLYLSMDPALVGRMRDEDNYAEKVNPGEIMHCYGVTQVIESRHPDVSVGEMRLGQVGMQEYRVRNMPQAYKVINSGLADPISYLSVVGITGTTAFFRMLNGESQGKQLVKLAEISILAERSMRARLGQLLTSNWFPTSWVTTLLNLRKLLQSRIVSAEPIPIGCSKGFTL